MDPATLVSVLLGEQLIHGLDLARSAGRPWSIARGDALRVIPGIMAIAGDYLDRDAAHGLHVSYDLRFGPGDRAEVVFWIGLVVSWIGTMRSSDMVTPSEAWPLAGCRTNGAARR
jgi:hypothetical protein